jgi:hypothetical protein
VGVADRAQLVRVRAVAVGVQPRQDRRVAGVAEALQLRAQEAGPARVDALLGLERAQRLEVVVELPRRRVEAPELAADELRRVPLVAEEAVARELDVALLAGPGRVEVERVQPLDRAAVAPERRLAARVPEQVDARARRRRRRADAEPVGRPERAEALPGRRWAVLEPLRLLPRDPPDRAGDEQLVRRRTLRPDLRLQPLRGLGEAGAGVFEVPDQDETATASAAIKLSPDSGEKK